MYKAQGYGIWSSPEDGKDKECDTYTCAHCQFVTIVKPKEDPASLGGFCSPCGKLICRHCVKSGKCDPFEKQMERAEARGRLLASILGG